MDVTCDGASEVVCETVYEEVVTSSADVTMDSNLTGDSSPELRPHVNCPQQKLDTKTVRTSV